MKQSELDTPALLIDIEQVEGNIRQMSDFMRGKKARLRAHTKVHKSPFLAHLQLAGGSMGITCAKVGEAEVMFQAGIDDILIANEVVGEPKLERVARLAKYCKLEVAVDSFQNAKQLSLAAARHGSLVGILVDLNLADTTGLEGILNRCGVPPGPEAVTLAKQVSGLKGLRLDGGMGYEGGLPPMDNLDTSREIARRAIALLTETADSVRGAGMNVEVVSCGGTTSYMVAADDPGVTEIQAGSYILMDAYHHKFTPEFGYALSLLTTVVSTPSARRLIVDAGGTAISGDAGLPLVKGLTGLEVIELDAEHIHIAVREPMRVLPIGSKLELIPTNIDTTTCLHDQYFVIRRGELDMVLDIPARGKFR